MNIYTHPPYFAAQSQFAATGLIGVIVGIARGRVESWGNQIKTEVRGVEALAKNIVVGNPPVDVVGVIPVFHVFNVVVGERSVRPGTQRIGWRAWENRKTSLGVINCLGVLRLKGFPFFVFPPSNYMPNVESRSFSSINKRDNPFRSAIDFNS